MKGKEKEEMYKKLFSLAMLTMMLLGLFASSRAAATVVTVPTFSVWASKTTGLNIDDTFTVVIEFRNFEQLWCWQSGLEWEAGMLECTKVTFGKEAYPESVFAVLAPERDTLTMKGKINNTIGKIYPPYAESLTAPGEGVTGTPDTKYKLMKIDFKVTGYFPTGMNLTPIETKWTAYPDVGIGKPHDIEPLTIYTVERPLPYGPEAKFTWTPLISVVNTTVTFDGSASKPGFDGTKMCPITEYRWDFDGDHVFDKNVTDPITTWTYTAIGVYWPILEVYAPGAVPETHSIQKGPLNVVMPPVGAFVDLYCNKVPFDGKGPDVKSDAFAPQELVILYAKVTYNDDPVAKKIVGFEVKDANFTTIILRTAITNNDGIATIQFRIPSTPLFGQWVAWAIVDVAGTTAADTMPFDVGWIINILSITPGTPTVAKGLTADFTLEVQNIGKSTKTPTLTVVIYDECAVPIAVIAVPAWTIEGEATVYFNAKLDIPMWAFVGTATVYANAFTDVPQNEGVPYCPEASTHFMIARPPP